MTARGPRSTSTPWNRLKPLNIDPLEVIGLPSKGDNRLLDHKTQERYYTKLVDRYMAFCSEAGRGDRLLERFARLELSDGDIKHQPRQSTSKVVSNSSGVAGDVNLNPVGQKDLSILLMAMRKLREGIVASNRVDDFSIQAYIFCIRLSIQMKHMESYHPAILHLLKRMHPIQPLAVTELQEFAGYLVLDLACRQNDLAQAYLVRRKYGLHESKIDSTLRALAHDNYFLFWRVKRVVDGYKAKIMEFAEDEIRKQTLKCLGRTYMTLDLPSLEQYTNTSWASLIKDHNVGWQLDGKQVIIRKAKTR